MSLFSSHFHITIPSLTILIGLLLPSPLSAQSVILPSYSTAAEKRLQTIQTQEIAFYEKMTSNTPKPLPEAEKLRMAEAIAKEYRSFLKDNPNHLYGYILLGKFLRNIDQKKSANQAFLKANAIDPNIAVVKQQIGNYLAEISDYGLALSYFINAIELDPNQSLYHYQLGELLDTFRNNFVKDDILDHDQIDFQMLKAFHNATKLNPQNLNLQLRYAQAFFDLYEPQWGRAIAIWNQLAKKIDDPKTIDYIHFSQARILIALERYQDAQDLLNLIDNKTLQPNIQKLNSLIQTKR